MDREYSCTFKKSKKPPGKHTDADMSGTFKHYWGQWTKCLKLKRTEKIYRASPPIHDPSLWEDKRLECMHFRASRGQPAGLSEGESEQGERESGRTVLTHKPSRPASLLLGAPYSQFLTSHVPAPIKSVVNHHFGKLLVLPVHCGGSRAPRTGARP